MFQNKMPFHIRNTSFFIFLITLFTSLISCTPRMVQPISLFGDTLHFSPDPHDAAVLIYRHPSKHISDFNAFIVDPVEIYSQQYGGKRDIQPSQRKMLADEFRAEAVEILNGYHLVDTASPGALRIRIRIKDIHPAHWELDEDRFILLKFDTKLESAAMELVCTDATTQEPIFALIHTLRGQVYWQEENSTRLENIRDAFVLWCKSLRKNLDEAKIDSLLFRRSEKGMGK